MNISAITIKRPVATIMILLMVLVLGVISVIKLPMDLMPNFQLPYAAIMTSYGNASPEEVESLVTENIESAVASVENLKAMMSYSMEGSSIVMVEFDYNTDMNFASLAIRDKVALISDYLPDECSEPMIMKIDMSMIPVSQIYISSKDKTLTELNGIIEDTVKPRLERAGGVASVAVSGGISEEIAVKVAQDQLASYGLSIATLSQLLAAENVSLPNGDINKGDSDIIIRTVGDFRSVDDIKNLPLMISDRSVVRLGDIASVTRQNAEQKSIARMDGNTAVGVMISKASDANTVKVSQNVNKALLELEKKYPDLNFTVGYDSADYIQRSIKSVATNALLGALLAIVVVFVFLRNLRATMIIAVSIPASLLAALSVMNAKGMTLNMVTLCALAICVGMLVDNSIVVLENIFRWKQELVNTEEAAVKGSKEIFLAVVASTLTTVMVFLPIALSKGMAGMLFADFCWTIIIALLASLVVAMCVIPMMFSQIMHGSNNITYIRFGKRRYKYRYLVKFADFLESIKEEYGRILPQILAKPKKFIISSFLVFLASMLLIVTVGAEILPDSDESMVNISVETPYGTSLEAKDKVLYEIEQYLLSVPEVKHVAMSTESLSMLSVSPSSSVTVTLCSPSKRKESATEIASALEKHFTYISGAKITAQNSESMSQFFGEHDITFNLKGKDREKLIDIARTMEKELRQMDCVETAKLDLPEGSPEVKLVIDRNTAAFYGITAYQLATGVSNAVKGTTATKVDIDGSQIDVKISSIGSQADTVDKVKQVIVTGSTGISVPVGQIANFVYDNAPSYIYRENQTNTVSINVDTAKSTMFSGSPEVVEFINNYQLPDGYFVENGGSYDQMMDTFGDLLLALIAAIALVFLLLAAQFESVIMAAVIMMAVPFAMTGAFLSLFITGTALSLTSFLGLIMLVGIVVNNSILLVEFINQYKDSLGLSKALVQAGQLRLRPILMSAVTTIVGMIPIALGLGDGGAMLAPMGVSIIGGLIASTVVTLFLIPTIYLMIENRKLRKAQRRADKEEQIRALEEEWAREDYADDENEGVDMDLEPLGLGD